MNAQILASPAPDDYLKRFRRALHKRKCGDDPRDLLPLREIARQTGVSQATLCRVLAGKTPDLDTFRALCVWIGQSADELLGLSNPPSAATRL